MVEAKKIVLGEYAQVGEDCVEWYDVCYWFRRFGLSGDPQHLIDFYKGYVRFFPDAAEVLEKLSRKYRLIIVTNSDRLFINALAQPVLRYFDRVFSTTSEFRLLKRNPEAYERVCEAMKVTPSEMVHVGDRLPDDFESPRSVGVEAYLLDRQDTCAGVPAQYKVRSLQEFAELLV
ncbi:MAG: HAD family hydrolase [Candidatus Bathyarchaeia archaeon]